MILAAAAAEAPAGTFTELMDHVAQGFEALAAAILVVGVIWSFVLAAGRDGRRGDDPPRGVHRAGAQAAAVIPGLPSAARINCSRAYVKTRSAPAWRRSGS